MGYHLSHAYVHYGANCRQDYIDQFLSIPIIFEHPMWLVERVSFIPSTTSAPHHIETSQLICKANDLTGVYMMGDIGRQWVNLALWMVISHSVFYFAQFFEPSRNKLRIRIMIIIAIITAFLGTWKQIFTFCMFISSVYHQKTILKSW